MIIRALDSDGDWTYGKGLSDFLQNQAAIVQNVRTRILSWVGDCFFALQEGVDWNSRLDVGQQAALVQEIKTVVLQSSGVVGVNSIEADLDPVTRRITFTVDIVTIFSQSFKQVIEQTAGLGS